jgi:hypothetical protein
MRFIRVIDYEERTTGVRYQPGIFLFLPHFEELLSQSIRISEKTRTYFRSMHWRAVSVLITQILTKKKTEEAAERNDVHRLCHGAACFSKCRTVFMALHG